MRRVDIPMILLESNHDFFSLFRIVLLNQIFVSSENHGFRRNFELYPCRRQSSTLRSHRLVHYVAKRHGWEKCEELYAVLNRRHFIEAGILNDLDLLLDSCEEIGLDRAICEKFLVSDEYKEDVLRLYG